LPGKRLGQTVRLFDLRRIPLAGMLAQKAISWGHFIQSNEITQEIKCHSCQKFKLGQLYKFLK